MRCRRATGGRGRSDVRSSRASPVSSTRSRRLAGEESAILPQPAAAVRNEIRLWGFSESDIRIRQSCPPPRASSRIRCNRSRSDTKGPLPRLRRYPGTAFQAPPVPFDPPDGESMGVPPGDSLSPALLKSGLERDSLCHGLVVICHVFSIVAHSFAGSENDIRHRSGAIAKSCRRPRRA